MISDETTLNPEEERILAEMDEVGVEAWIISQMLKPENERMDQDYIAESIQAYAIHGLLERGIPRDMAEELIDSMTGITARVVFNGDGTYDLSLDFRRDGDEPEVEDVEVKGDVL